MPELKILLGGLPLGCDNIGNEAILGCFVGALRRLAPRASVTVCTAERKDTAALLGVETAPLYGFKREHPLSAFGRFVRGFDWYVWCGGTGLSAYPAIAAGLLETARKQKVPTIAWGIGTDSEPDPVFSGLSGRARALFRAAELLTLGRIPLTARREDCLRARAQQRVAAELKHCRLIMVRDAETAEVLREWGVESAVTGADPAILQRTGRIPPVKPELVRIGFCVSDRCHCQAAFWNRLAECAGVELVPIPMNPEAGYQRMRQLVAGMTHPERVRLAEIERPAEAQALAASCDVVVSSRLHLLIFAVNVGTPVVGIEQGGKVRNFLAALGLTPAGAVGACDFDAVGEAINGYLADSGEAFRATAERARGEMLARLEAAGQLLEQTLRQPRRKR